MIRWLNEEAYRLVLVLDRFESVYQAGYQVFVNKITNLHRNLENIQ